jgi:hypothetical protein
MRQQLRDRRAGGDEGIAMITVILVGVLLTAIAVAAINISTTNLKNAGRDRVSGGALGAAEAGLAEAVNHLRGARLSCLNGAACTPADPWAAANGGSTVTLPDGRTAKVKIELIQAYNPPVAPVGRYRVTSEGSAGSGPGRKVVQQELTIKPFTFPLGVFANQIQLNGTPKTFQESIFSRNCVGGREKMDFTDPATGLNSIDAAYGIPAAVHSADVIYEKACPGRNTDRIHHAGACNPKYPYDQDSLGGPEPGKTTPAFGAPCKGSGTSYPQTSYFSQKDLDEYGASDISSLLPVLRAQAQAQGQYYTNVADFVAPNPAVHPNAVIYFKVGKDVTWSLQNELDAYNYDCANPKSVVIVVDNAAVGSGGLHINSNNNLSGALFVPRGNFQYNGGARWTGTIYANTIDKWNGNAMSQLTSCYLQNLPPGLLDIEVETYRELDSAS